MVGTYTFKNYKNSVADEMAKSQAKLEQELARAEESKTTNTTNVIQEQQQENAGERKVPKILRWKMIVQTGQHRIMRQKIML